MSRTLPLGWRELLLFASVLTLAEIGLLKLPNSIQRHKVLNVCARSVPRPYVARRYGYVSIRGSPFTQGYYVLVLPIRGNVVGSTRVQLYHRLCQIFSSLLAYPNTR